MISRFAGAMFLSVAIASVSQVLLKKVRSTSMTRW